tara:strand:+ start:3169 stop:4047 length:879 start_codon:yes stop_codon:yes gene_type:complete
LLNKKKILVLIIAYNDEEFILDVLKKTQKNLYKKKSEIIVINDNSKDKTFEQIYKFIKNNKKSSTKISLVENPKNRGYGKNQKMGYLYSIVNSFDVVVMVHGDGQFGPEKLEEIIEPILKNKADAVLGSRMKKKNNALKGKMPIYKFLGNIFLTFIQNLILGSNLSEFHTGYRAYSPKKLNRVPFIFNSNSFVFDTEILIQLIMNNFKIFEIPVKTTYSTQISNLKVIPYGLSVLNAVIQFKLCKLGLVKNNKYSKTKNNLSQKKKLIDNLEEGLKNGKKKIFNFDNSQKPN